MTIDTSRLKAMLRRVATLWHENAKELGVLDSRFGDGDHGVTVEKIAKLIDQHLDDHASESMKSLLAGIGDGILGIGGGSAVPLYGTMVEGLAEPLDETTAEIDGPTLKAMFAASFASLRDLTTAEVGDKTMMDAIIPAISATESAADDPAAVLAAAAEAGLRGAEESKNHVAKFGRARHYGEETLGCPDVGAVSASLFFQGLSEGFAAADLA